MIHHIKYDKQAYTKEYKQKWWQYGLVSGQQHLSECNIDFVMICIEYQINNELLKEL